MSNKQFDSEKSHFYSDKEVDSLISVSLFYESVVGNS